MNGFTVSRASLFAPDARVDVLEEAARAIDVAVRRYRPTAVFGLFSGGHDSLCAVHLAAQHPAFTAAVHVDTGIGVPETRQFVEETCASEEWPLLVYSAEDEGQFYDAMVLDYGFPGPYAHRFMYTKLKERAIRSLIREHRAGGTVLLVNGARKAESRRRTGNVKGFFRKQGGYSAIWVAPIISWLPEHKEAYINAHDLARNPVVDAMHMSGECLCGAYAHPGELEEWEALSFFAPGIETVTRRIRALEKAAKERGVHCRWNDAPPDEPFHDPAQEWFPMCSSCEFRNESDRLARLTTEEQR